MWEDRFACHNLFKAENEWTFERVNNVSYLYDGDGRRVETSGGASGNRMYWYDHSGEVLEESDDHGTLQKVYFYLNGAKLAYLQGTSSLYFYYGDHLGTTRMMTDGSGNVCYNADYFPWGGEDHVFTNTCSQNYKFTAKERDPDLGVYNMGARFYQDAMGRFYSPDPIGIMKQKLLDPQQWNMYSYVRNNPLRFLDPTGAYLVNCGSGDKKCNKAADNFEKQREKDLKSKDIKVRNAAAAWGDRGQDNHVNVTFKSQAQVDSDAGNTDTQHHRVDAIVTASPGADHRGEINAEFSENLGGSDLGQTIAHEGEHVEDDFNFLKSYDSSTGKYNPALNFTHFDAEFQAFEAGAGVKSYSMFPSGPKGYQQLQDYIYNTYHDADEPVFPPSGVYPQ